MDFDRVADARGRRRTEKLGLVVLAGETLEREQAREGCGRDRSEAHELVGNSTARASLACAISAFNANGGTFAGLTSHAKFAYWLVVPREICGGAAAEFRRASKRARSSALPSAGPRLAQWLAPMTTSGLVLTLEQDDRTRAAVIAKLERDSRITLGQDMSGRLPIVTETAAPQESEALFDWLLELPGVCFVDVVYVDFGRDHSAHAAG
jgi:hypothetical protein